MKPLNGEGQGQSLTKGSSEHICEFSKLNYERKKRGMLGI